uniref:Uncharacterized protein n=1 Tax=Anguilla anguilla TaxID=7936 RepID=A0A0E9QDB9_ANGAN
MDLYFPMPRSRSTGSFLLSLIMGFSIPCRTT